jgi:4-oxalocrotonate tautomerase family enzyme
MPIVKIDLKKGKTIEFHKIFMDLVHASMVEVLQLPTDDRNIRISEFDPAYIQSKPPYEYFIEIIMFAGRTKETKSKLFRSIVSKLKEALKIAPTHVFIVINEQPKENWGIRGGVSAADIKFDFNVNI